MAQPTGQYGVQLTFLWRAAFKVVSPEGKTLFLDPWLTDNPHCPPEYKDFDNLEVDVAAFTHWHQDHMADVVPLAKRCGAHVISAVHDIAKLEAEGLTRAEITNISYGGSETYSDMRFALTPAWHSGEAAGLVVHFSSGFTLYHGGDTNLFTDMELIRVLHRPNLTLLPIGDRFTMDPYSASLACKLYLQPDYLVPMHYPGNWRDPATASRDFEGELRQHMAGSDTEVLVMKPGETINF